MMSPFRSRTQQHATWSQDELRLMKLENHTRSQHNGRLDPNCPACKELSKKPAGRTWKRRGA
jgi:hypothetical protein